MVPGLGDIGDTRVTEAIDRCLARLRQGEPLERCLADHPELADELRPLLETARAAIAAGASVPPPPGGLAEGRARLLAAADGTAEATDSARDARLHDVLDRALARVRAGEAVAAVLLDHPELADELRPLLETARAAIAARAPVPAPPHGLAEGRARLLAAANGQAVSNAEPDGAAAVLDEALAALRAGESVEAVLAAHPQQADALRPLIETVRTVQSDAIRPPPAPTRLARSRDRFLAAADELREAAAAPIATALDAALDAVMAGGSAEDVLAARPDTAEAVRPLVETAQHVMDARASVPAPPHGLAAGRERLLAAAADEVSTAARPSATDTDRGGLLDRLRRLVPPGFGTPPTRLVGAALAVALFFVLGGTLVGEAQAAIPGDPLYGLKRLSESVRYALTLDPVERRSLQVQFSRERAKELEQAVTAGREAEVDDWQVELQDVEAYGLPKNGLLGQMRVTRLKSDERPGSDPERYTVVWGSETSFDLEGEFDAITAVPTGSTLSLRVQIRNERLPLARAVRLISPADTPVTATATLTSPTATATTAAKTPAATAVVTATSTVTTPTATATLQPTVTLTPTAAVTATVTVTVTATPTVAPLPTRDERMRTEIQGVLATKEGDGTWIIERAQPGARSESDVERITVNVRALEREARTSIQTGDLVRMRGRFTEPGHVFQARHITRVPCPTHTETGMVITYIPGEVLVLRSKAYFDLAAAGERLVIEGEIRERAQVTVEYEACTSRRAWRPLRITVEEDGGQAPAQPTPREFEAGLITQLDRAATRFALQLPSGQTYRVDYAGATVRRPDGTATELERRQRVIVIGTLDSDEQGELIRATEVIVVGDPPPATPTPQPSASPASATPTPTPDSDVKIGTPQPQPTDDASLG